MSLGLMNKKVLLCKKTNNIDSEGFFRPNVETLAELRVFVEEKHGSERWANLAAFSEATHIFRFRYIPNLEITTKQYILYNGCEYNILSVENVKNRNMYIEIMAKKVVESNG